MTPLSELLNTITNCDSIDELNRWLVKNENRLIKDEIDNIETMVDWIDNRFFDWFDQNGLHDTNIEYPMEIFQYVRKKLTT